MASTLLLWVYRTKTRVVDFLLDGDTGLVREKVFHTTYGERQRLSIGACCRTTTIVLSHCSLTQYATWQVGSLLVIATNI